MVVVFMNNFFLVACFNRCLGLVCWGWKRRRIFGKYRLSGGNIGLQMALGWS